MKVGAVWAQQRRPDRLTQLSDMAVDAEPQAVERDLLANE